MANDVAYGLDSFDTLAAKRGAAITCHNRLTRGELGNNKSMIRATAARIGQLNDVWEGLKLKPKPVKKPKPGRKSVWQQSVDSFIKSRDFV
ncbi:hypothetical protein LCGC14_0342820 [marine sediment metagenome]|uniref:Uncharacterized protein n=1 Tax=marine sediment metagenome TaxID=412755 RepID=A0A0F9TIL1_9ZZZZ